jgi:hypothetical protein
MKKIKDHFAIIAGGGKMILQWLLKTVFEGVYWFHMTQDSDR